MCTALTWSWKKFSFYRELNRRTCNLMNVTLNERKKEKETWTTVAWALQRLPRGMENLACSACERSKRRKRRKQEMCRVCAPSSVVQFGVYKFCRLTYEEIIAGNKGHGTFKTPIATWVIIIAALIVIHVGPKLAARSSLPTRCYNYDDYSLRFN